MDNYNPRYARHYALKDFGFAAQEKLRLAKVLVIGAGGLGCPALQYLTAAGVGTIGIVDHDVVSISNLQRQVLYDTSDIGLIKTKVAARKLSQINPEITIITYESAIATSNAFEIIADFDIVIDCTDNFASRYLINDACVLLNKPLVFGAVYQYEGQVAVFNSEDANGQSTNYRDLFPSPPNPLEVADCNEAGVLGVLPGIIGTLQATEAIKLITGIGEVLRNKLLTFNLLTYENFIITLSSSNNKSSVPSDKIAFMNTDYDWFCGTKVRGIANLSAEEFVTQMHQRDTMVIDVRNPNEKPEVDFTSENIPLVRMGAHALQITESNILLFCQSGKRSLKAAEILLEHFGNTKNISHLKGGIIELLQRKQ